MRRHGGQGEACNDHPGNGSALEGETQARRQATLRGLGSPDVRQHGNPHADVSRRKGRDGADQESESRLEAEREHDHSEDDDAGDPHALELAVEVGDRAFADCAGNLMHLLIASRRRSHSGSQNDGEYHASDSHQRAYQR